MTQDLAADQYISIGAVPMKELHHVAVNGLIQTYGTDFVVGLDAPDGSIVSISFKFDLVEGDKIHFSGLKPVVLS